MPRRSLRNRPITSAGIVFFIEMRSLSSSLSFVRTMDHGSLSNSSSSSSSSSSSAGMQGRNPNPNYIVCESIRKSTNPICVRTY